MNNVSLFLSDCEIMGLRPNACVIYHLAPRPLFYDLRNPHNLLCQYKEWAVYTQIPFRLLELRGIFALARKYNLIPEKQSAKVDELLTATKEALERFEKEKLYEAGADFFAMSARNYLHNVLDCWHQWADGDVLGAGGIRMSCWTPIDLLIKNNVT